MTTSNATHKAKALQKSKRKLAVQLIFGIMTVCFFVVITYNAIKRDPVKPDNNDYDINNNSFASCKTLDCKVICTGRISKIEAILQVTTTNCMNVTLTLQDTTFRHTIMPKNLLEKYAENVVELIIDGGNLRSISERAFKTDLARNIIKLSFYNVIIEGWNKITLEGLDKLKHMKINNCVIRNIDIGVLEPVPYLEELQITFSGYFDPLYFIGTQAVLELKTVDFSANHFGDIIHKDTFSKLIFCEKLFLNQSKIVSIDENTFETLENLRELYLNDNFLISFPIQLLNRLSENSSVLIHLQNNLWFCDCKILESDKYYQILSNNKIVGDIKCFYPKNVRGLSIDELKISCLNDEYRLNEIYSESNYLRIENSCNSNNEIVLNSYYSENKKLDCDNIKDEILYFLKNKSYFNTSLKDSSLSPLFYVRMFNFTMLELDAVDNEEYGLIWSKSSCPEKVFCMNLLPNYLRMYNVNFNETYWFCLFETKSLSIDNNKCLQLNITNAVFYSTEYQSVDDNTNFILVMLVGFSCTVCGAVIIYTLIRNKPILLKGSKRILFVKHKGLDALVLPPKVSLKNDEVNEQIDEKKSKVFFIRSNQELSVTNFMRTNSIKSHTSNAASYISAIQPTDDQLTEWRLKSHFNRHFDSDPVHLDLHNLNRLYENVEDLTYCSISERIYESLN